MTRTTPCLANGAPAAPCRAPEPPTNPPPWIHTITGSLGRSDRRGARRSGTGNLQMGPERRARRPRERVRAPVQQRARQRVPCPEPEARPDAQGRQEAARRNVPACSSPRSPRPGARPSTAPPAAAAATAGRRQEAQRRGCPCRRRLRRRPCLAARRYPPSRLPALAPARWSQHSSRLPVRPASTREVWSRSKPRSLFRSVLRAYGIVQAVSTRRLPKPPAESA